MNKNLEVIKASELILCYLIRNSFQPEITEFITPPDEKQQIGFIVYPSGSTISRHTHLPHQRHLRGMAEAIIVRSGQCQIDLYDDQHELIATRDLYVGDVVLLVNGGHGFRIMEDTVLMEIKLGPFLGKEDKELF
jgi:hypothetical protein